MIDDDDREDTTARRMRTEATRLAAPATVGDIEELRTSLVHDHGARLKSLEGAEQRRVGERNVLGAFAGFFSLIAIGVGGAAWSSSDDVRTDIAVHDRRITADSERLERVESERVDVGDRLEAIAVELGGMRVTLQQVERRLLTAEQERRSR